MNSDYYRNGEDIHFVKTTLAQERELFDKARAGDAEAREFLIRNHLLFAATKARKIVNGRMPDEEVISAVNEALVQAVDVFDHTRGVRFTCYLLPVIKGVVSRMWPTHVPAELKEDSAIGFADSPAEECERKEMGELFLKALDTARDKLNQEERDLLVDYYTHGLSFAEIGRRRGVTREAVRARHERILVKLRKHMKGVRE